MPAVRIGCSSMTDKLRGRTVGAASKVLSLNVYQTNGCPLNPGDQRLYIRYSH